MVEGLKTEIATYEAMEAFLFEYHWGRFVVIKGRKLHGVYDAFIDAARAGLKAFGGKSFLLREVKEQTVLRVPTPALHNSPLRGSAPTQQALAGGGPTNTRSLEPPANRPLAL